MKESGAIWASIIIKSADILDHITSLNFSIATEMDVEIWDVMNLHKIDNNTVHSPYTIQ